MHRADHSKGDATPLLGSGLAVCVHAWWGQRNRKTRRKRSAVMGDIGFERFAGCNTERRYGSRVDEDEGRGGRSRGECAFYAVRATRKMRNDSRRRPIIALSGESH